MSLHKSQRARGSNRGGCGGGYEHLDPDHEEHRIRRMRQEYESLDPRWRAVYLEGLNKADKNAVTKRNEL